MLLKAIYVQLIVLVLTLLWFAFVKRRSDRDLLIKCLAVAILLFGLWWGSVWVYPPYWAVLILALIFTSIAIRKFRQAENRTNRVRSWLSNLPAALLVLLGTYLGVMGFQGHGQNPDGPVIDLVSPFAAENRACIISGGLNSLVNQHNFKSDRSEDKAETYGLDVMGFGKTGFRTNSGYRIDPKPKDTAAYVIYGMPVYAPCAGIILQSENDQPDHPAGYKVRVPSNGVTLACGNVKVVMAHLQRGSVGLSNGEAVKTGQLIGRVGNSGHTEEPHLHLHAETILDSENPELDGSPVHMRFGGKFLARGDCF